MGKIVCFGEIMLRLSPPEYNLIESSNSFMATFGGSEANIAVSLACLGSESEFFSKLPKNQLGDGAIKHLRGYGVCVDHIVREHENMGIYFLESGFGARPSRVLYNRRHSAITTITREDIDFDAIFAGASWFHVSGITLALGPNCRLASKLLMEEAVKRGLKVSFDFNYRSRLWKKEDCRQAVEEILPLVDVLFASRFDAQEIMGIKPQVGGNNDLIARNLFDQLLASYKLSYLFGTERTVYSASENALSSYVYLSDNYYRSAPYRFKIFDRVGGGDAFASGVIHVLNAGFERYQLACEFGLGCSVLKHTLLGDAALFREKEVLDFMNISNPGISR